MRSLVLNPVARRPLLLAFALASATSVWSSAHAAPQASLTVSCATGGICNATNTEWSLEKSAQLDGTSLTWTVNAVAGPESNAMLNFKGSLSVTNSGSANATIGNIVVNLQKKRAGGGNQYATIASNVANATWGDYAIFGQVCSGASSERFSSFSENSGSGTLEFSDANSNTVFSLVPQKIIAPGQTVVLNYSATYDATVLGIQVGQTVRLEAIVSFGNSGGRGDSGASCSRIDINGNGFIDADESNVRSVPCRSTWIVPVVERSNRSVILSDTSTSISSTGTASFSDFSTTIGGGSGFELLTGAASRTLSLTVNAGSDGGSLTNCALLYAYPTPGCNLPASLQACSTVVLDGDGFRDGEFCSYTQGGWGAVPQGGNPGVILASNFGAVYPYGIEVGISGSSGNSMIFYSAAAVGAYLPAGGTASPLITDLINPTSTSSGVFGGQVLALALNVGMNQAGVIAGDGGSIAGLVLQGTGTSLDGSTVAQILAVAQTALGGGGLPADYTFGSLNALVTELNQAFDNCSPSGWAQLYLR